MNATPTGTSDFFHGHAKWCPKLSLRQGPKGHRLYATLEGRSKFMTQAWPYLAAGSLKGLELKSEMIEREGEQKKQQLECSLVAAGHCWSNMDLGLMQEVCAFVSLCAYISCMHAGVFTHVRGEKRETGLMQTKAKLQCVYKISTCMQNLACLHACWYLCERQTYYNNMRRHKPDVKGLRCETGALWVRIPEERRSHIQFILNLKHHCNF